MKQLRLYLDQRKEKLKSSIDFLHKDNKFMTEDETKLVINVDKLLGHMGVGIDKQVCLHVFNAILCVRSQEKDSQNVTKSVVKNILKKNQDIIQLVHGNAIDPARIRQADEEFRDCQSVKF